MATIKDSNRFGTLDLQTLSDFEKKYKFKLPEDYRQFLLEFNGGYPYPSTNLTPSTDVNWIYGIHSGEYWSNLVSHIDTYYKRIPLNTLPIATDSGGNQFLLSLRKDTYGEVWFWDHENECEGNAKAYFDNITKSASSFTEFLDNLYEYIDADETEEERIIRTNDITALIQLLDAGYDLNTKDDYDRTIIENASISNKIEIVKILLHKGSKLYDALGLAKQNMNAFPTGGYEDLVKLLEEHCD